VQKNSKNIYRIFLHIRGGEKTVKMGRGTFQVGAYMDEVDEQWK
jgi:hypothetical protein